MRASRGRTRHAGDAEILWLISLGCRKETREEMFFLLATNNSGYLANKPKHDEIGGCLKKELEKPESYHQSGQPVKKPVKEQIISPAALLALPQTLSAMSWGGLYLLARVAITNYCSLVV